MKHMETKLEQSALCLLAMFMNYGFLFFKKHNLTTSQQKLEESREKTQSSGAFHKLREAVTWGIDKDEKFVKC